jgi:hypothetical protein
VRTSFSGIGLAAMLFLLSAFSAGAAPAYDAAEIRDLLGKGRFSPPQTDAALALLERTDRRGLPVSALTHRLREGIARKAEPKAILGVLEDRLAHLERADEVARRCAQQGVPVRDRERALVRLADSFAQGVTPGDVTDLIPAAAPGKTDLDAIARAAEVMGRLERKGFPPRDTRDVVASALSESWEPDRMEGLVGLFLEADMLRLSPDETREALVTGIREKKELPRLEEKIQDAAEDRGQSARDEAPGAAASGGSSEERRDKGKGQRGKGKGKGQDKPKK